MWRLTRTSTPRDVVVDAAPDLPHASVSPVVPWVTTPATPVFARKCLESSRHNRALNCSIRDSLVEQRATRTKVLSDKSAPTQPTSTPIAVPPPGPLAAACAARRLAMLSEANARGVLPPTPTPASPAAAAARSRRAGGAAARTGRCGSSSSRPRGRPGRRRTPGRRRRRTATRCTCSAACAG